jgi:hypothetical protein
VLARSLSALLLAATAQFGAPTLLAAPPLEGRVLDLALLADGRLLVLTSSELARLRIDGVRLRIEARRALPTPLAPVRKPAGLLVLAPETVWVASNRLPDVLLLRLDGPLPVESRAPRLPWPGAAAGLRHVQGTDLLDGRVVGLPPGPYLDLVRGLALSPRGQLLAAGGPVRGLRLGPPLCLPWPDLLIASGAAPPSSHDELIAVGILPDVRILDRLPLPGPVQGVAVDVRDDPVRALVAVGQPPEWLSIPLRREP